MKLIKYISLLPFLFACASAQNIKSITFTHLVSDNAKYCAKTINVTATIQTMLPPTSATLLSFDNRAMNQTSKAGGVGYFFDLTQLGNIKIADMNVIPQYISYSYDSSMASYLVLSNPEAPPFAQSCMYQ